MTTAEKISKLIHQTIEELEQSKRSGYLSPRGAADYLDRSVSYIDKLVRSGQLVHGVHYYRHIKQEDGTYKLATGEEDQQKKGMIFFVVEELDKFVREGHKANSTKAKTDDTENQIATEDIRTQRKNLREFVAQKLSA
jgi:hypothetical protein